MPATKRPTLVFTAFEIFSKKGNWDEEPLGDFQRVKKPDLSTQQLHPPSQDLVELHQSSSSLGLKHIDGGEESENTTKWKWKWKYHQGLREDSHHIRCSSSPPSMGLCYQFYWIKLRNPCNNSRWWVFPMMICIAVIKMINLLLLPWLMMKSAGDKKNSTRSRTDCCLSIVAQVDYVGVGW